MPELAIIKPWQYLYTHLFLKWVAEITTLCCALKRLYLEKIICKVKLKVLKRTSIFYVKKLIKKFRLYTYYLKSEFKIIGDVDL